MKDALIRIVAALLFVGLASDGFAASAAQPPLSVKVTNAAYGVVFFVLDGNFACTVEAGKTCYFSEDCMAFPGQNCMGSTVKAGVHLVKVDWGLGSITKKITVGPGKPIPECEYDERMGDAKLSLNC